MRSRFLTKAGRGIARSAMAALIALVLQGRAEVSLARPTFQEDFKVAPKGMRGGEIVSTPEGSGWRGPGGDSTDVKAYVEYPVTDFGLNPAEGTIEFDVTRDERSRKAEAMFSLMDAKGDRLYTFRIYWEGREGRPVIHQFQSNLDDKPYWYALDGEAYDYNYPMIPFAQDVGRGRRVHVALTWGNGGAGDIFIDGRRLATHVNPLSPFSELVSRTATILVGGETDRRNPQGAWSMAHSVIGNFQIHDRALVPSDLAQTIERAPVIAALGHDAPRVAGISGKLVQGDVLGVTLEGSSGAVGTFDIVHFPDLQRRIALDWRGWGVFGAGKVFFDTGEVNLRDVEGYRVYASTRPFDPGTLVVAQPEQSTPALEPVAQLDVKEQSYLLENLEIDTPYYVAVVAVLRDGTFQPVVAPIVNRPTTETEPGVYAGSYEVNQGDRYPRAAVVGRLTKGTETVTFVRNGGATFAIDPALTIAVATEPDMLKADETSTAKVTVTVTDAKGNAVADREIRFLLATTSQYTGVVGGGAFAEQVGGAIKSDFRGRTDLFGRVTATYVAGFAAKTAIIVARDMAGNSTGAGHVRTFIQGTAQLELEPVQQVAAMAAGYEITVTSSDKWLTADGKSQARITARVTLAGEPVEGHRVAFQIAEGTGEIRTVSDKTGRDGKALAVYTAGKKIGLVLITATDLDAQVSGSVQIELRSDAPAKIGITVDPEKLPADGRSRADLAILVTDINDNPNANVQVEYAITEGGGELREETGWTDLDGESQNVYTAGRTPGRVTIGITVRSTVPTEAELGKARDLAVAVTDYEFF